jgi:hypothetical protein
MFEEKEKHQCLQCALGLSSSSTGQSFRTRRQNFPFGFSCSMCTIRGPGESSSQITTRTSVGRSLNRETEAVVIWELGWMASFVSVDMMTNNRRDCGLRRSNERMVDID